MKPSEALLAALPFNITQGTGSLFDLVHGCDFCACAIGQMAIGSGKFAVDLPGGIVVGKGDAPHRSIVGEIAASEVTQEIPSLAKIVSPHHPLHKQWCVTGTDKGVALVTLVIEANDGLGLSLPEIAATLAEHGF